MPSMTSPGDAEFAQGEEKFNTGDYNGAMILFKQSCEKGNAYGQFHLGYMIEQGKGCIKNSVRAFFWYKKSALQGNAYGQSALGQMYLKGSGCIKSRRRAFEWFQKSAQQGNALGQYNLGYMMEFGDDKKISANITGAFELYQQSAEQGNPLAQNRLGMMYLKGKGCVIDIQKAFEMFEMSANRGNADAQCHLGEMYEKGLGCVVNHEKAFEMFQLSAEEKHVEGRNNLGIMYEFGRGCEENQAKAFAIFDKCARQAKLPEAYNNLGRMYEFGKGCKKDLTMAFQCYIESADLGDAMGQFNAGRMYELGKGCATYYRNAIYMYQKSANQGNALAQASLGHMYASGKGCKVDYDAAFALSMLSAQQGNAIAQFDIGMMYVRGEGCEANQQKAKEWLQKAADQGSNRAIESLERLRAQKPDKSTKIDKTNILRQICLECNGHVVSKDSDPTDYRDLERCFVVPPKSMHIIHSQKLLDVFSAAMDVCEEKTHNNRNSMKKPDMTYEQMEALKILNSHVCDYGKENKKLKIVKGWFATDVGSVRDIFSNGFPFVDGAFGEGIYFSLNPEDVINPRKSRAPNACFIVCYLLIFNPYPITDDTSEPASQLKVAGKTNKDIFGCNFVHIGHKNQIVMLEKQFVLPHAIVIL